MLKIRSFRRQDADVVCDMMQALSAFHGETIDTTPEFFIDHCLGRRKISDCLVAFYDGKPAGFVLSYDRIDFVKTHRRSLVDLLYVSEAFRGQKIGEALMEACVKEAQKRGCREIFVTAEKNNKGANDFYQRIGWTPRPLGSNRYKYPE